MPQHQHRTELFRSELVSIADFCCRVPKSGPAGEEINPVSSFALLRRGIFVKHVDHCHCHARLVRRPNARA